MYTAKYLIYSYSLFTVSLIILSFSLIVILLNMRNKSKEKNPIINIVYKNESTELYTALKMVGATLTTDQQRSLERVIINNRKEIGFHGRGGDD